MNLRYLIGFLGIIAIVILVIILIVRGGSNGGVGPKAVDLSDYINGSSQVSLTIDGPVTADITHRSITIAVDERHTNAEVLRGYEGTSDRNRVITTNETLYANFIQSLKHAGFTNGINSDALKDYRGFCPTGQRYIYQLKNNNRTIFQYWSTSCGGQGTFKGNASTIQQLFKAQVPNYDDLTSSAGIY
jgi:hypothetical protein